MNAPIAYSSGHYKCGEETTRKKVTVHEEGNCLSILTVKSGSSGKTTPCHMLK